MTEIKYQKLTLLTKMHIVPGRLHATFSALCRLRTTQTLILRKTTRPWKRRGRTCRSSTSFSWGSSKVQTFNPLLERKSLIRNLFFRLVLSTRYWKESHWSEICSSGLYFLYSDIWKPKVQTFNPLLERKSLIRNLFFRLVLFIFCYSKVQCPYFLPTVGKKVIDQKFVMQVSTLFDN